MRRMPSAAAVSSRWSALARRPAARLRGLVEAAGRLHDEKRAGKARALEMLLDLTDIAAHLGAHIGIGHHGRAALELAVLLAELVRGRHEQAGMGDLEDRLRARLVIAPRVAVEEQDRARLDAELIKPLAEPHDLGLLERRVDLAVGQHALACLEAQRPLDQRFVLLEEQIVGVRAVDAADLVDVAKTLRDQERGAGAGALQDRVDGDRRAVQEEACGRVVAARLGDAGADAVDQAHRGRQHLAEGERPRALVENRDIREGAPDIGRKADAGPGGCGPRC